LLLLFGGAWRDLAPGCGNRHIGRMEKSSRRTHRSRRRVAAATSIQGKIESGDMSANLDFAWRMKGKLPEMVTTGDLEILNSGLQFLFADLRHANRFFRIGEGNGRGGAATALGALWRFITLFEQPLSEMLHMPILDLQQALVALEHNNVSPMLKPPKPKRPGRAKSSPARDALKGHVAGTVQCLLQSGITPVAAAHRRVAKVLDELGVRAERGRGNISATTVRHWCDEVDIDVGRGTTAAINYDSMFTDEKITRFSALPSNEARQGHALTSLAAFVRVTFPRATKPS
jgi:hypothetical protein